MLFNLSFEYINYYIQTTIDKHLSVRELEYKIKSNEYERLSEETRNKLFYKELVGIKKFKFRNRKEYR